MEVGNTSRDFVSDAEESLTIKDSATVPYLVVALNSATGVDFNIPVTLFGSSVVAETVIIEEIIF